jgi:hypothetical protein
MVVLIRPAPGRDPPLMVPEAYITVQASADDVVYALRRAFL